MYIVMYFVSSVLCGESLCIESCVMSVLYVW